MKERFYTREDYTPDAQHPMRVEQSGELLRERPPDYFEDFVTCTDGGDDSTRFSIGYQAIHPSHGLYRRTNRQHVLRFVVGGSGTVGGKPFGKGDFFYTASMTENTILPDPDDPWQIWWFSLTDRHPCMTYLFRTMAELETGRVYHSKYTEDIASLLRFALYSTHTGVDMDGYLAGVVQIIDRYLQAAEREQDPLAVRAPTNMARAKFLIEKSVIDRAGTELTGEEREISIADFARTVGLERKYFCKLFSETYGYSPKEYLMQVRLRYSQHYLAETEDTMEQIAAKLGYKDHNSFLRMFRERTGMTPIQWRRAHHKNS